MEVGHGSAVNKGDVLHTLPSGHSSTPTHQAREGGMSQIRMNNTGSKQ